MVRWENEIGNIEHSSLVWIICMLSDTFLWILYQLLEHSEPLSSQIAKEGSRMNTLSKVLFMFLTLTFIL